MAMGKFTPAEYADVTAGLTPGQVTYTNGFEIHTSLSDMGVVLLLDGVAITKVSMSYTTAKSLGLQLSEAIKAFEQATGHTLMTMDEVHAGLSVNGDISE